MTLKELTKKLQAAIGVAQDGDFGPVTQMTSEKYDIDIVATEKAMPLKPEAPAVKPATGETFVLIVGHEKTAGGAAFALGGNEYQYNSSVAAEAKKYAAQKGVKLEVVFRDGVGISGAYKAAAKFKPAACIELHFNAFNGKASGTETLSSSEPVDQKFAAVVQAKVCEAFGRSGLSRGVKVLTEGGRGGGNIYALPGKANCLVEGFFGDNKAEATLANEKKTAYAHALVDAMVEFAT